MPGKPKTRRDLVVLGELGIDSVCEMIASGGSLRTISASLGVSQGSLHAFLSAPEHSERYVRARAERADRLAEETLEIADGATPEEAGVAKLRVDTRRWFASKLNPQVYGDRVLADIKVLDVTAMHVAQLRGFARPEGNSVGNSNDAIDVTPVTSTTYDHVTADDASVDSDDSA